VFNVGGVAAGGSRGDVSDGGVSVLCDVGWPAAVVLSLLMVVSSVVLSMSIGSNESVSMSANASW
jgi:hypothetical protein